MPCVGRDVSLPEALAPQALSAEVSHFQLLSASHVCFPWSSVGGRPGSPLCATWLLWRSASWNTWRCPARPLPPPPQHPRGSSSRGPGGTGHSTRPFAQTPRQEKQSRVCLSPAWGRLSGRCSPWGILPRAPHELCGLGQTQCLSGPRRPHLSSGPLGCRCRGWASLLPSPASAHAPPPQPMGTWLHTIHSSSCSWWPSQPAPTFAPFFSLAPSGCPLGIPQGPGPRPPFPLAPSRHGVTWARVWRCCWMPSLGSPGQLPSREDRGPVSQQPCGDRKVVPKKPGVRALEWEGRGGVGGFPGVFREAPLGHVCPLRGRSRRVEQKAEGWVVPTPGRYGLTPVLPESGQQVGAGVPFMPGDQAGLKSGKIAGCQHRCTDLGGGQATHSGLSGPAVLQRPRFPAHVALCLGPPEPLSQAAAGSREQPCVRLSLRVCKGQVGRPIIPREYEQSGQGLQAPGPQELLRPPPESCLLAEEGSLGGWSPLGFKETPAACTHAYPMSSRSQCWVWGPHRQVSCVLGHPGLVTWDKFSISALAQGQVPGSFPAFMLPMGGSSHPGSRRRRQPGEWRAGVADGCLAAPCPHAPAAASCSWPPGCPPESGVGLGEQLQCMAL